MLNVEGQTTCKQQLFGAFPDFQFSLSVVSDSLRPQRSLTLESDKGAEGFESRLFIHIYNFGGGRSGAGAVHIVRDSVASRLGCVRAGQPRLRHCLHTAWSAFQTM